jgi:S-adenosylmethionine-diacylglycerol 3-amino-3-carboxypropyl transferase
MTEAIEERARFDAIRYANVWEDARVLCAALEPRSGKRILSIASAGDNVLALLAEGAEVVAADLSPAQLACVELRRAAFRRLDHAGVLAFLGARPSGERLAIHARIENDLSPAAREFWRSERALIEQGAIHGGKFERYFRLFRTRVIPLIHGKRHVRELLAEKDEAARRDFYERTWNNRRWRLLFRVFFSRFVMGRLGRDPEFFRYVEGSVADRILERSRYALTTLPTHDNPFLDYILTGNFSRALPDYLEPRRFEAVRAGLDRLTLHHGPVEKAAAAHRDGGFDGFNLSDIFEYLDEGSSARVYSELLDAARSGARFAYWNMLAPRRAPRELAERVRPREDLAREGFARDRAFFYSAFVVEEAR